MGRRLITVEDLEKMTPAERQASFDASIVRDLSQVPPAYLARIRAKFADRIEQIERAEQERTDQQ